MTLLGFRAQNHPQQTLPAVGPNERPPFGCCLLIFAGGVA